MIVVVGGPTAAGKSALALAVAERVGGEILCADSRQVYAGVDIAAGNPSGDEVRAVVHHGYGSVDALMDKMTAGRFVAWADRVADEVIARGKVPILVGGTGLYLRAWRIGLDDRAEGDGGARDAAAWIARAPRRPAAYLLVDLELAALEPRILARVRSMYAREGVPRTGPVGVRDIVDEAVRLASRLPADHALLGTIGTAEALLVAAGVVDVDEAVRRTALRTRQYARRQRTWFKKEPWWTRVYDVNEALPLVAEPR